MKSVNLQLFALADSLAPMSAHECVEMVRIEHLALGPLVAGESIA